MLRMLAGEAARRFGARAAVVSGGSVLTFADLDRHSDAVAAGLAHRGVRIGDVVVLALPNGPEFVICYLAAAKVGAVTAGVGTRRLDLLRLLDPAMVVTAPRVLPPLPGMDVVTLPIAYGRPYDNGGYDPRRLGGLRRAEAPPPPYPPDPGRPVVIAFTAGSTGAPRGAVFCEVQLDAIRARGAGVRWGGGDARLVAQDLGHMTFATRLPVLLQTGRTSHVLAEWTPEGAVRVLREHGLRVLQGAPRQLAEILASGEGLPGLELVLSMGGAAAPALIRSLRERYRVPVCNRYVCTEAGLGLGTRPEDPPVDAEETVGRPRPGVDLSIRDAEGRVLEPLQQGEVLLRSRAVMTGYIGKYPDQRAFAKDGFVRTGDRGYIDGAGRLHLVGRIPRS
ncbi:class I adenylate-forming enzyme family protein [Nonomuraea typhae]|uniref:Class I adenylate-forming enzyme family protein n=1 Tax=Nonomuraea typhae TaxID=2603600 RepID=A0ABW7YRR4_9ACTN